MGALGLVLAKVYNLEKCPGGAQIDYHLNQER